MNPDPLTAALLFSAGLPAEALLLIAACSIRDRIRRARRARALRGTLIIFR